MLGRQLAAQHGDGLAAEVDALAAHAHAHHTAAGRGLVSEQRIFAESSLPERPQTTVRRAGDRKNAPQGAGLQPRRFGGFLIGFNRFETCKIALILLYLVQVFASSAYKLIAH